MRYRDLPVEEIYRRLDINPETGKMTRKSVYCLGQDVEGYLKPNGSRIISLNKKILPVGWAAWVLYYREKPIGDVLYLNGDNTDTRKDNLFDAGVIHRYQDIPHAWIRRVLSYSPETGEMRWIKCNHIKRNGDPAGSPDYLGYKNTRLFGLRMKVHNLIFKWMTGRWPEGVIDHKDGDATNNRWENLRECTQSQNLQNARGRKNTITGIKGVVPAGHKFVGKIKANDGIHYTEVFEDKYDAAAALRILREELHGEFARHE